MNLEGQRLGEFEILERLGQEAVAAAGLTHPNLVQVYSAGENEGLHWFAMEYVEGESAKARLRRKGRLDPLEAIAIVLHVTTALEYDWRKAALIHRDIKPDNIFLSSDGGVKLGDLGLAKSAGQTQGLTMTGTSMGTPHYISPEQAQAMKSVDLRADMGGNVWQWCEDWWDGSHKDRVLRGASWNGSSRDVLLSSGRNHIPPGYRSNTSGFRCVLEVSAR